MYCENCGSKLRENAAFCPKCGTAVKSEDINKEGRQYTSLVPDYNDIDENKSVAERVSDIEAPLFNDEGDTYEKPKKNKKKLIITLSICLAVIVAVGVIVLLIINQPALTIDTAYKKYTDMLERDRDQIVEFSQSNGSDNIAVFEDGETAIPCVLYITYGGNNEPVLHTLFSKEKSIEIDTKLEYTNYAVVQRDKMTFFKVDSDDHIYFWFGKNIWQLDSLSGDFKYFAQILSSGNNVTEYTILENGENKEVSEKEYNDFISNYLDSATTIIISALPDNQINQVFPNIKENLSMNYENALAFLNAKKLPYSNNDDDESSNKTNDNDETQKNNFTEPPTEPPKAEDFIEIYQEETYYNKLRNEDISYTMPLLAIDSPDSEVINAELISAYEQTQSSIDLYKTGSFNDGVYTVNYDVWLTDSILSLCVEQKSAMYSTYMVYNIDINSKKALDNETIAEHYGATYDDIFEKIRSAVDEAFMEKFGKNSPSLLEKYRQQTLSDDNIKQAKLFIGDDNRLYVMHNWYMEVIAALGNNICVVDL